MRSRVAGKAVANGKVGGSSPSTSSPPALVCCQSPTHFASLPRFAGSPRLAGGRGREVKFY